MDDRANMTFEVRDEFHRRQIAENAIKLLRSDLDTAPMLIDGGWGTGKTEFCYKLINLMREDDTHHLIYIDAFKADHADEPLMTVIAAIVEALPDSEDKATLWQKAIPAIRFGLKTAAKAAVNHVLRQDADDLVGDYGKAIEDTADMAIDATVGALLKDHVEAHKNIEALQHILGKIATEKPLILFIDELDRCRPDFAVDMLEIIKHTFDVEGVSFVLVTNTQQLKASINHCYGHAVDAQRYLDKFLRFTFTLPAQFTRNGYEYHNVSLEHYAKLTERSPHLSGAQLYHPGFLHALEPVIKLHRLSLREIETFVRHLEFYQTLMDGKGFQGDTLYGYSLVRLFSVLIFTLQPEFAESLLSGNADAEKLGEFLGVAKLDFENWQHSVAEFIAVFIGQFCQINADKFMPITGGHAEKWARVLSEAFNGGWVPDRDQQLSIFINVIRVLSLSPARR